MMILKKSKAPLEIPSSPERVFLLVGLRTSHCFVTKTFSSYWHLAMHLLEAYASGLHHDICHCVRVTVCCWAAVFHVPASILLSIPRNTDRGSSVGHTILELVDRTSLVFSSQAFVIALSVDCYVLCSYWA